MLTDVSKRRRIGAGSGADLKDVFAPLKVLGSGLGDGDT
jgi:hypothetical protein